MTHCIYIWKKDIKYSINITRKYNYFPNRLKNFSKMPLFLLLITGSWWLCKYLRPASHISTSLRLQKLIDLNSNLSFKWKVLLLKSSDPSPIKKSLFWSLYVACLVYREFQIAYVSKIQIYPWVNYGLKFEEFHSIV